MPTINDFSARAIDGSDTALAAYSGQVVLVVNTASKCGFTPQYLGLQELQDKYGERGFTVLGFPCDQFGNQEPGAEDEIASFCERNFGVDFPLFAKVDVNGKEAHPLFEWLRSEKRGLLGGKIKWNAHLVLGRPRRRRGLAPLADDRAGQAGRRHREGPVGRQLRWCTRSAYSSCLSM